jgi:hypothetical protein
MDQRVNTVAPVIAGARAALARAPKERRAVADSLLQLAEDNLALVRNGKPAHNVAFADQLLRAAVDLARQAMKAGGVAYAIPKLDLGKPVDESGCSGCHVGAERARVPFKGGGTFPHEPHALKAQLRCTQCHTPIEQHGGTRLTSATACQDCHHGQATPTDCVNCHKDAGAAGKDVKVDGVVLPHSAHQRAMPTCAPCHVAPTMKPVDFKCANCHDKHHAADRTCASCHQDPGLKEKHADFAKEIHAAEPPCSTCHDAAAEITKWTWQTCTVCHANKASGHYEKRARTEKACLGCHDLKAIAEKP